MTETKEVNKGGRPALTGKNKPVKVSFSFPIGLLEKLDSIQKKHNWKSRNFTMKKIIKEWLEANK